MKNPVTFFVPGAPQPKGSTRAFMAQGKPRITSDNPKVKAFADRIALAAAEHAPPEPPSGAIAVNALFTLPRPQSKRNTERYPHMLTRPDVDKLLRTVLDALTGVLYVDDKQVVEVTAGKAYGWPIGVRVGVEVL